MTTIPSVQCGLPLSSWHIHSLLQRRLGWVRLTDRCVIKLFQVEGATWISIVFPANYHPVAPRSGCILWDRFQDPELNIAHDVSLDLLPPVHCNLSWSVYSVGHCPFLKMDLQSRPMHHWQTLVLAHIETLRPIILPQEVLILLSVLFSCWLWHAWWVWCSNSDRTPTRGCLTF